MNLGSRIVAWFGGKKLPYARRLAYLRSSGEQYINTGIVANTADNISIKCQPYGNGGVFGARSDYISGMFLGVNTTRNAISIMKTGFGGNANEFRPWSGLSQFHFSKDNDERIINGITQVGTLSVSSPVDLKTPIWLFANSGEYSHGITMNQCDIYEFEIEGKCKLIPVMSFEGNPEMYDEISGTFAERHGDFLYGELNGGGGYKCLVRFVKSLVASFSSLSRYLRKEVAR